MNIQKIIFDYKEALYDTDHARAVGVIHQALANGVTAEEVVFSIIIPAIDQTINQIILDDSLCLAQHFLTAQISSDIVEEMLPLFKKAPQNVGHVVLGTAFGDLHSLGKRIVAGCLRARLIDVIDLGVNVPPEKFVQEAVAHHAEVIAISAMMLHTARSDLGALGVRRLMSEQGITEIRLVVGGAPFRFNPDLYLIVQADAWAPDGISASRVIGDLIREVHS